MTRKRSLQNIVKCCVSDICGLHFPVTVTPAQHLLTWFTPERRLLINALSFDKLASRPYGTLSRFLVRAKYMTLERAGVHEYYPMLRLLGYHPDLDLDTDEGVLRHRQGLDVLARQLVEKKHK